MKIKLLVIALAGLFCAGAYAGVLYSDDFESGTLDSQWIYGVNNYAADGVTKVGEWFVGADPAPITVVSTGQSGAEQGTYVLKSFGDYGYAPNYEDNKWLDTIIYIEHAITAAEAALGTVTFDFDFKAWPIAEGGIDGVSEAGLFIKVLDQDAGWAEVVFEEQAVTAADVNWTDGFISADISAYEGKILQWGIHMNSQNYSPTAIATDNMQVEVIPEPATMGLLGIAGAGLLFARRFRG